MNNRIRFATLNDTKDVRHLWDACFEEDSVSWRDWYFKYIYRPQNTILLFEDENLASMIQMNPYPMYLNNKTIKVASLAGVATYKEYRKKGYAGRLIDLGLREMQKRGIAFTFLYPFNYDFYRKFGYELCYDRKIYNIKSDNINNYEMIELDETYDVTNIYNKYCSDLNGYIVRNQDYLAIKLKEHFVDNNNAYLIKQYDKDIGYCLLHEEDSRLIADELISQDIEEAASAISSIFGKPVEFESPYDINGNDKELKPHCMGRVIDIYSIFNGVTAKKGKINIQVIDDIIDRNNDTFIFDGTLGSLNISTTNKKADFTLDIKELSQIAVGYRQGVSEKADEVYNLLFEEKNPWIKEVC